MDTPSSDHNEDLSPKQLIAFQALASGQHIHEAAAAAGINRRTLTRWLQLPIFRAALNYELQQITQQTAIRSVGVTIHALEALDRLIASGDNPAIVIQAARAILQHRPHQMRRQHDKEQSRLPVFT